MYTDQQPLKCAYTCLSNVHARSSSLHRLHPANNREIGLKGTPASSPNFTLSLTSSRSLSSTQVILFFSRFRPHEQLRSSLSQLCASTRIPPRSNTCSLCFHAAKQLKLQIIPNSVLQGSSGNIIHSRHFILNSDGPLVLRDFAFLLESKLNPLSIHPFASSPTVTSCLWADSGWQARP